MEDNSLVQQVFLTCLKFHDVNAVEQDDGEEALQTLKNNGEAYDVVFLDRRLDSMSGVEVLKRVAAADIYFDPERIYIVSGDHPRKIEELIGDVWTGSHGDDPKKRRKGGTPFCTPGAQTVHWISVKKKEERGKLPWLPYPRQSSAGCDQ